MYYVLIKAFWLKRKEPASIYTVTKSLYQHITESLQLTAYPYYSQNSLFPGIYNAAVINGPC